MSNTPIKTFYSSSLSFDKKPALINAWNQRNEIKLPFRNESKLD